MLTAHENPLTMSFKKTNLFSVLWNLLEIKKNDGFHIMVLFLQLIEFPFWLEFLIGQFIR